MRIIFALSDGKDIRDLVGKVTFGGPAHPHISQVRDQPAGFVSSIRQNRRFRNGGCFRFAPQTL